MAASMSGGFSLCAAMPKLLKKNDYGKEDHFLEQKKKAISELAQMVPQMAMALASNPDTTVHYKAMLVKACELRQKIARQMKTPDAAQFGLLRTAHNQMTYLYSSEYSVANDKIKNLVLKNIPFIKNKDKGMRKTIGNTRYTFRLMRYEKDERLQLQAFEKLLESYDKKEAGNLSPDPKVEEAVFGTMMSDEYLQKMAPLAKKLSQGKVQLDDNFYIYSGRIELKIDEEWRALTGHFAVIACSEGGEIGVDHIEAFKRHSFAGIMNTSHEDFPLHETSMAQLFNTIIQKKVSKEELYQASREFEYRLHHLSYTERGSAAINEMILNAINPEYPLKGNLQALSQPYLSKF